MEEKVKLVALVGAGALLGSVTSIALLRFYTSYLVGRGFTPETSAKGHDVCGDRNHGRASSDLLKDEIVSEQLTRNIQFFGIESQHNVSASYVVVIGLGGVGSHAASMLLRSGVGRLLLVDFDQVSVSSLNRHAVATREDVGIPKAHCLKKHFLSIFPECLVEAKVLLYDASSEEEILSGHPDFVLDCIDNIDTKVALLAACVHRGLKVLSAMGAGARADPTRIRVADLRESTNDPLSRAVRHRLRKDYGIEGGIPVVFSLEKPRAKLLPFKGPSGGEENPSDYQIVPGFRVRIIPVLGTIPAIFGQVMASYVITQLAGFEVQTEPLVNFDMDHYRVLHQRLIEHEELLYGTAMQVQVDVEEVMYIAKELWRGRSARDEYMKDIGRGMWRSINDLMLVRWDRAKPAAISNLVLLRFKEADEHELQTLEDIKENEPEFFSRVSSVLKRAELDFATEDVNFQSVPDLQKSMYKVVDGFPCVRLLNLSGEIGCSNPGREKVVAPIVRYKNADKLAQLSAILVSLQEFDSFFLRVSNDVDFAKYVGGVLVESGTDVQNELKGVSMDEKFPQAEFSPYKNISYQWNPIGSGIMWNNYDFPVFLLSDSSTSTLKEAAIKNEGNKKAYTTDVAEFDLVMQTTKSGTRDSESCLKEGTCLPLGGYSKRILLFLKHHDAHIEIRNAKGSVWSALPPVNTSSSESSKHIILAVASMDSASFFRDKSLGADSPISGLISLLVAVDALSHVVDDLGKQLVFVIFTGEAWGFLGSRRFLLELDQNSDAVNGLNSSLIDMILEVGSVGKGFSQGTKGFFAHTTQVSAATNETLNALKLAQHSLQSSGIDISRANASNPGIPPSSLMAFLRKVCDAVMRIPGNSQTSGVVLEDFDSAFTNQFYHSHLDDLSNINSSSIVAAASIVARTLYILASNKKDLTATSLSAINVNASLVEELMGCLLSCEPGLSCGLVNHYISPTNTCPSHYVGVLEGEPSSTPYPGYISDVSRFLWNFLAEKTSIPSESASSGCPKNCSGANHLCVRSEIDGKGVCVVSTTRCLY
ncbi:hypothetical protein RHMOL_Rhmol10G0264500 [Rhododendron molle]|uniref:Uncharacterized protein n=1 Tax=Rhododendron molle TaxID=49168 RepID=A0ACC0M7Y8_RHOML|nr:hypothetical protein RHMOL_Rhmol10G0264500 [Rhododendron molle]